jgi:hypothetical protein
MPNEGKDYVKSLCPLYAGLSIWYKDFYKELLGFNFWLILKIIKVRIVIW